MYWISDDGASILFQSGTIIKRVIKHKVCGIQALDDDRIRIDLGDPLQNFCFRKSDVEDPFTVDVHQLCDKINTMITKCVCCNCETVDNPV